MPPSSQHPDPAEDYLPSLTDGPTASSVSGRKSNRPDATGRKYFVDGAKFRFEFPFGRNKSKKKKEKNEGATKLRKSNSTRSATSSHRHRSHTSEPNVVFPEAPDPPTTGPFTDQLRSAQYTGSFGMNPHDRPRAPPPFPPPLGHTTSFDPPVHYPQSLDPRIQQSPVYEERTPPSIRQQNIRHSQGTDIGQDGLPSILLNSSTSPRTAAHVRENSRQSVNFDLPPQSEPPRSAVGEQRAACTSSPTAPEENSYNRRYELREAERERSRQLHKIEDLEEELDRTREELSDARTKADARRRRQEESQRRPETREARPSSTAATVGSSSMRSQPPPASDPMPHIPSRHSSYRSPTQHNQTQDRYTERLYEHPPSANPAPHRHSSHRPRHSHPPPDPYSTHGAGAGYSRSNHEVEARISRLEAEILALRRAQHTVEDDLQRQAADDAYADALHGEHASPRLRAYDRLIGVDDNDFDRDRMPWDPGTRDAHLRERQRDRERAMERRSWQRAHRRSRHGVADDDLRAALERTGLGPDQADPPPPPPPLQGRPWSWESERRRRRH